MRSAAATSGLSIETDPPATAHRRPPERLQTEKQLGPALFFLDQFGYSQIPMSLVKEIMRHGMCEVFSYLNCQRMNHFLNDQTKWAGITEAFGDESWKPALHLSDRERQEFLIQSYRDAIRRHAGVDYVWSFAMFGAGGHLIHWLIFATNSLKGLYEMKRAMFRADERGEYRFSDRVDEQQQSFLSELDEHWLADHLSRELAGRTMAEREVEKYVLTETPLYSFKNAINLLRKRKLVTPAKVNEWPVMFAIPQPSKMKLGI